jgi:hypothetical protein
MSFSEGRHHPQVVAAHILYIISMMILWSLLSTPQQYNSFYY